MEAAKERSQIKNVELVDMSEKMAQAHTHTNTHTHTHRFDVYVYVYVYVCFYVHE